MMIVPMKVQEIDDVAQPNPIHQVPHGSAEQKGEGKGMEGIIVIEPPVDEKDCPDGNARNNDEKGSS